MHPILRWSLWTVVTLAVLASAYYALRPRPVPVDTAPVTIAPMAVTVNEEGQTRIRERYIVSSPLRGRLRRITLDPGDTVEAQQTTLAIIEPTAPDLLDARSVAEAEARVRAAQAAVRQSGATAERARAAFDHAENELARLQSAFDTGAANRNELDEATTNHRTSSQEFRAAGIGQEIATYELEVARSALLFARGDAENDDSTHMIMFSPIDGVVLRVFQESVAVVTPGTPLIEVGDPRALELVIDVLSTDAVTISPGDRVIIDHWGGDAALEGVVQIVEPSAFTKISALGIEEQRVNVIADFVSPGDERSTLGDGFRVEAAIVTWEGTDVLQVPTSAMFRDGERWAVFLVQDSRAQLQHVTVGRGHGRATEVVDGLDPGDRVIVHPSDQVSTGVRIIDRLDI